MVDAEVADALVDNVGAVGPVLLDEPAPRYVIAVPNLHQPVRMVNREGYLALGTKLFSFAVPNTGQRGLQLRNR